MTTPSLSLGIDTGGTFTDGVLFNPQKREVVKTVKVLTTHHDLRICISEAIARLLPADRPDHEADYRAEISVVSLSTTLATNAIAEGKRRRVALLLLGYDPELVHQFKFQQQFGTKDYFFVQGRHDLNGVEQAPLDELAIRKIACEMKDRVEAFAVSSYAGPMNAGHEERAAEILAQETGLPVVQAHDLSSELDSIRRATTASLNASLLSNIQGFLEAVEERLRGRGVQCPVLMVRGDGSIVKSSFALRRPVEMIHSGPATSAIGGQFLAGVEAALVIDMGGTTTDIALVDHGQVQILEGAATVGPYRTCVKTIKARSFGLGGDSLISFDRYQNLAIGPERAIPLSRLCSTFPEVKGSLLNWMKRNQELRYSDELEYWVLRREPRRPTEDETLWKVIQLLRKGPQRFWDLKKQVRGLAPIFIRELVNREIIDRAGLTPTDLLHVSGEFTPWDCEVVNAATELAAKIWNEDVPAFVQRVNGSITARIAAEVVQFLSGRSLSDPAYHTQNNALDRWLFAESLTRKDSYLGCKIFLKTPVVGIGAPARTFLPAVAEALGTEILFPDHYEVANAVGAVVGNVMVRLEGEVYPCVEGAAINGYFARAGHISQKFDHYASALAYARETLIRQAEAEARTAGTDDPVIEIVEEPIWEGMARLSVWAAGKPSPNGSH